MLLEILKKLFLLGSLLVKISFRKGTPLTIGKDMSIVLNTYRCYIQCRWYNKTIKKKRNKEKKTLNYESYSFKIKCLLIEYI